MQNDLVTKCKMCKHYIDIRDIQEHHIHPGYMGNPNKEGSVIGLCKKCHGKLHWMIHERNWENVSDEDKADMIDDVIKFTDRLIK